MTRVQALEDQIARLTVDEFAELEEWLADYRADAWDKQIEADAKAGKFDEMARQAREDIRAGKATPI